MRIFVPLSAVPDSAPVIAPGTLVWGVDPSIAKDVTADEAEQLDLDAVQEAVLVTAHGATGAAAHTRVVIAAVDVPDDAAPAEAGDNGDHARRITADEPVRIRALHVSELTAAEALADEFAPDVLWFDPSETAEAFAYASGAGD
ncbi:hypothetical protein M3A96_04885 [Helcobacillus massiliensis]|uniref:hypothetical protein n=1 Tax=Helcobacillus massiliensis TaxID=521392 RepID=UPI0021A66E1A|nr:hypothetical protein [Helcobacillus massiliensis]MCT1557449.1 hypothetical protein [Helcobacillus massiliensis]MCT2036370.1 hypothetical protein [Helcobacillus massiliensis]MCT2331888.1 hypothetical protein [Helcobacillus massiliensis]MDK7742264.1 hypothetical protein [Helcobacillus massiliensis]WOO93516.1 hypothetical protein R3I40_02675 [Helcobacillus massiliensis]